MPSTRSDTFCWLLGQVDSVLDNDWTSEFYQGKKGINVSESPVLAFKPKPKLPTKGQVLKLLMFYRKSDKFKNASNGDLAELALEEVYKYWRLANIPGMAHWWAKNNVIKLLDSYRGLVKSNSQKSETEEKKREKFINDLENLFDIASSEAEDILKKDRLLDAQSKSEDILFLEDQRGPRLGWINLEKKDFSYENAVEDKDQRDSKKIEWAEKEEKG